MIPARVPERALAWWRSLDAGAAADDLVPAAMTLALLAHRTPAWTEHHVRTLDRLLAADPGHDPAGTVTAAAVRSSLAGAPGAPASNALDRLLATRPAGPLGRARAALALALHDRAHGTDHAASRVPGWAHARDAVAPGDAALVALLLTPVDPDGARALGSAAPSQGGAARLLARERGDRLDPGDDDEWSAAADVCTPGAWAAACAGPPPRVPMVVGVDTDRLLLSRAVWWRDGLYLTLAPHDPSDRGATEFRVVGAEPRIWFQSGIDGATTDTTSHGMVVRTPLAAGDLEFTPGSY